MWSGTEYSVPNIHLIQYGPDLCSFSHGFVTHSSVTSCSSSQASRCVSWLLPVLLHVQIRSLYFCNRASYSLSSMVKGKKMAQTKKKRHKTNINALKQVMLRFVRVEPGGLGWLGLCEVKLCSKLTTDCSRELLICVTKPTWRRTYLEIWG